MAFASPVPAAAVTSASRQSPRSNRAVQLSNRARAAAIAQRYISSASLSVLQPSKSPSPSPSPSPSRPARRVRSRKSFAKRKLLFADVEVTDDEAENDENIADAESLGSRDSLDSRAFENELDEWSDDSWLVRTDEDESSSDTSSAQQVLSRTPTPVRSVPRSASRKSSQIPAHLRTPAAVKIDLTLDDSDHDIDADTEDNGNGCSKVVATPSSNLASTRRRPRSVVRTPALEVIDLCDSTSPSPAKPRSPSASTMRSRSRSAVVSKRVEATPDIDELCATVERIGLGSGANLSGCAPSWLMDVPRANFARSREALADRLLVYLDREALGSKLLGLGRVTVSWSNRLLKTAGMNHFRRRGTDRFAAIDLSCKVVDEPSRLYNTLAHEMCHAAAWIFDEVARPPHGQVFKKWAEVFRKWDRDLIITTCHSYDIRYKFYYECVNCHQRYGRHSKSIDTQKQCCGVCKGRLVLLQ